MSYCKRKPHVRSKKIEPSDEQINAIIGDRCVCCGTKENLTLDHIEPLRRTPWGKYQTPRKEFRDHPERFQRLCALCNSSKGNRKVCTFDHTLSSALS